MFSSIISKTFHLSNLNLLYLDDKKQISNEILDLLKKYFHIIKIVSCEDEAIDTINLNKIDLVLVDIEASCTNGVELIEKIRDINENISLIIFSKFQKEETFIKSLKLCADGYILKPIDLIQFNTVINKVIQKETNNKKLKNNINYIEQFSDVINNSTIVSKTDFNGKITYVNNNFCKITGYEREELIGKNHNILRHKDTPSIIYKNLWETIKDKKRPWHGILKNISKNGSVYYSNSVIKPLCDYNGNIIEFIAFRNSIDVVLDDKKHLLKQIELNVLSFLIMIQIQEFDILEKFYNVLKIDQLEKAFASHLLSYLPDNYMYENVYTLGDGRFAILTDYNNIQKLNININDYLEEFVKNVKESILEIDGIEYDLNIVLSYACGKYNLYDDARAGLEDALNKNSVINYSNDSSIRMNKDIKKNFEIIKMVKIALDNYKIVSYFQPIINNQTKEIDKYESLVRLIDEDGNIISPYEFLHVTKSGNYYNKITLRVLENSFKMLTYVNTKLSINLSVLDIEKKETREEVYKLLEQYENDNDRIVFELLEDERVKDFKSIRRFIRKVKNKGVQIAIDDFGSGYSNFERLLDFEPDILKIDGSLIKNIEKDKFSRNIIETIVTFAKKQNILTIAEYVENESIFNLLYEIGVDYSQGFYFGEPKAFEDSLN
jgi:PAS domain S-box-containing protein